MTCHTVCPYWFWKHVSLWHGRGGDFPSVCWWCDVSMSPACGVAMPSVAGHTRQGRDREGIVWDDHSIQKQVVLGLSSGVSVDVSAVWHWRAGKKSPVPWRWQRRLFPSVFPSFLQVMSFGVSSAFVILQAIPWLQHWGWTPRLKLYNLSGCKWTEGDFGLTCLPVSCKGHGLSFHQHYGTCCCSDQTSSSAQVPTALPKWVADFQESIFFAS